MTRAVGLGFFVGVLALGCARQTVRAAQDAGASTAILFISADMRGYLGPCGCSENMRGGIGRAAYQILEAKKRGTPVLYLDSGDSLFPSAQLAPAAVPEQERKAQALAEAMKLMGIAARTVGEKDDARGASFRQGLGLPDQTDGPPRVIDVAGHKLGVVSAQDGEALAKESQQARSMGAEFVVGLLHDTFEHASQAAAQPGIGANLIVASHAPTEFTGEDSRLVPGAVAVAEVQSKGRSLLRVDLTFGGSGTFEMVKTQADTERELAALDERIALLKKQIDAPGLKPELKSLYQGKFTEVVKRRQDLAAAPPPKIQGTNAFSARFVPLEATLPEAPQAQAIVGAYDKDVSRINLAWAREHGQDCPPPAKGEAAYVGNARCKECHEEAFPVWEGSKHAHAYETLVEKGKNYHLDCVRCHVTGYDQPGGVCRVDKVDDRKDVLCEACHGPGSIHSDDPSDDNVVRKPGKELCMRCHDPENSPHFDYALYLPEILGPGHGKPGPKKKH